MKFLSRFEPYIYGILRIVIGFLFSCHGVQKIFGVLGGHVAHTPLDWAAAVIELGAGVLIAFGFLTRCAAFIASGEMAVGYFMFHARASFFPIVNHGEPAVVYCFLFLYMAARGTGKFGIEKS